MGEREKRSLRQLDDERRRALDAYTVAAPVIREVFEDLRASRSPGATERECTGWTAVWCPIHGDCICDQDLKMAGAPDVEWRKPGCPLHDEGSTHGSETPARPSVEAREPDAMAHATHWHRHLHEWSGTLTVRPYDPAKMRAEGGPPWPVWIGTPPVRSVEAAQQEPAVDVVAAVRRDKEGRVWLARRGSDGAHAGLRGMWEYPGGKVEPDEQIRDALVREMDEEFGVRASVGRVLDSIESSYGDTTYRVTFFEVTFEAEPELRKHTEARWMTPAEACSVDHLPSGTVFNARHLAQPRSKTEVLHELRSIPDALLAGLKNRPASDATWDSGYKSGIEVAASCVRAALATHAPPMADVREALERVHGRILRTDAAQRYGKRQTGSAREKELRGAIFADGLNEAARIVASEIRAHEGRTDDG